MDGPRLGCGTVLSVARVGVGGQPWPQVVASQHGVHVLAEAAAVGGLHRRSVCISPAIRPDADRADMPNAVPAVSSRAAPRGGSGAKIASVRECEACGAGFSGHLERDEDCDVFINHDIDPFHDCICDECARLCEMCRERLCPACQIEVDGDRMCAARAAEDMLAPEEAA